MHDRAEYDVAAADQDDPLYLHAKREAKIILGLWAVCLVFTCTAGYLFGYNAHPPDPGATGGSIGAAVGTLDGFNRDAASLSTPLGLGIPDWVFYSVILPWGFCIIATFWFCLFVFRDDDLGANADLGAEAGTEPDD